MLESPRAADPPSVVDAVEFEVGVHRDVPPPPGARGQRTIAEEAVGSGRETVAAAIGADRPRIRLAFGGLILFVPPLGSGGDVHHFGRGAGTVEVETDLALPVAAEIERGRRVVSQRGVDGIVDEEVGFVLTHRGAGVPDEVRADNAADAADHRDVPRLAAEIGCEPAGEPAVEGKAVGVGCDRGQRVAVRHVVNDRHGRAIAGARDSGFGPPPVAHQQSLSAVRAENAATRVRVAEEKPARHPLAREIGVSVRLKTAVECVAEVAEELDIAVHFRRSPDLRRFRHYVGVASCAERDGVAAGRTPVGRIGTAVFQAEIGETVAAQGQADVGGHAVGFAVTLQMRAGVQPHRAARWLESLKCLDPGSRRPRRCRRASQ